MISRHGIPTWSPGAHLGVVWPHGVALVSDDLSPELGGELWQRVHASTRLTDFVRALAEVAGVNVLELPEFAVAIREGESWHLAVRGEMQVEVQYGSAAEVLRCRAVTTWTERTVYAPTAITAGVPVWARIPVIPGVNDAVEDAPAFAAHLLRHGVTEVQLLPFHQYGERKYELLGWDYAFEGVNSLHEEDVEPFRQALVANGAVATSSKGRHGLSTTTSRLHPAAHTTATSWAMPTAMQSSFIRAASRASTSRPKP